MANFKPNKDVAEMTCKEIFSAMLSRQLYAIMFHDQMSTYFDFLGLEGFRCIHDYQYLSESMLFRDIQSYYMKHYNEFPGHYEVHDPDMIPEDWLKHKRSEVTSVIKKRAIKEGFDEYLEWEKSTEQFLNDCAKALYEKDLILDYEFVVSLMKDVQHEIERAEEIILKMSITDYDLVSIEGMQDKIHKEYAHKMHHIGKKL